MTSEQATERARASWRWRGTYVVVLAAAVGALVAGVAYASLSATGYGTGSASTGSVVLSVNSPATRTCNYSKLSPGDLTGSSTCALSITYTGSISAYVGLSVLIITDPGVGGTALYTANSGGLTFSISDGSKSYTVPATPITGTACTNLGGDAHATCYQAPYELAEVTGPAGDKGNTTWNGANSDTTTLTVTPLFPFKTVGNAYQGGTATLSLTTHAVQSPANAISCNPAPTIGSPCSPTGSFTWGS